jgi:hypothetical protein
MKNIIIISFVILFATSCTHKLTGSKYTAIEPWKEWQIELKFNKDSTFTMIDRFGCNRFNYSGLWHYHENSILKLIVLNDTTKSEYIKSHDMYQFYDKKTQKQQVVKANEYFPVISNDTIKILSKNQISFRGLIFNRKKLFGSNDLGKERTKMIEDFYVNKIGRKAYIKAFGNGKGIKEARKNINDCKTNPLPNVELRKGNQ